MMGLDEMVAFVTGGTRGIGRAMVLRIAEAGGTVYTCGRTESSLEGLRDESRKLDGTLVAETADVTSFDQLTDLTEMIDDAEGQLDLLVNNAGVLGPRARLEDVSVEAWRHTLEVNTTGVFLTAKASLELLRAADESRVVNISSSVGREGRARWGPYAVSKHGVEGLTETLADELEEEGIPVVSANPGGTATDMRADAYPDEDPDTLPSADRVAETLLVLGRTVQVGQTGQTYDCRELFEHVDGATLPAPEDLPVAD
jgi:NAD(P)-dependent dehydrogenase (short-subunit alcohol dehydrogenase family)